MYTTHLTWHIRAPRARVYAALLDPTAIPHWKVPQGMTCHVHRFEPWEGGRLRISLTYDKPSGTGKTTPHTDTYNGRFETLVSDERMVEVDEFETEDPAFRGEMRVTITLAEVEGGTLLSAWHEGVPAAVPPADNALGWRMALERLEHWVAGTGG